MGHRDLEQPGDRDAPLTAEGASASIQRVLALLAASPERIDVLPVGGKGLANV